MIGPVELLNSLPLAGMMLVIALGYALGELRLRGVSLGPAGATLFVSLFAGHLGIQAWGAPDPSSSGLGLSLGTFGFMLFIYSVGFEAGPRFFSSLRDRTALRYVAVAVVVYFLAILTAVVSGKLLDLEGAVVAGALAGALTSAPTFAAASELVTGMGEISVAFALTYPFGLVGVVLLIQILPGLLGQDLARDAEEASELLDRYRRARRLVYEGSSPEQTRVFRVERDEVLGRPLRELELAQRTGTVLSRIRRGEAILVAGADTLLERGDHVTASGNLEELRALERLVGPEIFDARLQEELPPPRRIQVRDPESIGKSLAELRLTSTYHTVVTRVVRDDLEIEPTAGLALMRGDIIEVVGERPDVLRLARRLGRFEPLVQETHIAIYAGGILLGILLGAPRFDAGEVELGLGLAGGLLISGLLLGWAGRIGPVRTEVPLEARQLVRDLGILLFIGETGLTAGDEVARGLRQAPWATFGMGVAITVITVLGALLFGRWILRLRPVDAWGSLSGGLTSSAALLAVRRASDSNEAAVSYAVAYAVGSVLATAAGRIILRLMA